MEFIKIRNSTDVVRIKITIDYVGPSEYIYVITPGNNFKYSSDQIPNVPYPQEHDLVIGEKLLTIGNRANNWSIQLINPSTSDLDYDIKIDWYQGNDGAPLYTWPSDPTSQKGTLKADMDHILFSGNCVYEQ